ncbi:PREDICTED: scarecrow-like protein 13 isoform X1 [Nicotiana attenuata]|uniref:Scarecrow-like protein 13 n=1 Tax=Nicotiana attenuata TaxID=49451 RepID=A0A314KIK6_NICAT|nr:PREDICTED: scarecrow-like protein 13 isoform X1 [Nicotiana attenuata]XP_019231759.1 PREDICTED: scarecrow-like protein 13 isoform X1 [Nicotiana attenuata]OIT28509.1 scarecrow-like protein 13 [Nicotiana attenuata]
MQASQRPQMSGGVHGLYNQPVQQGQQYYAPYHFKNNNCYNTSSVTQFAFQTQNEHFFTLDSLPATDYVVYDSPPALSVSSNRSPLSPQCSQSYMSDLHHSSDNNTCGSPFSGCSGVDDGDLKHVLRELENKLLGPESDTDDSCSCSFNDVVSKPSSLTRWNRVLDMAPSLNLKELLDACAEAVSDADISTAEVLMNILEQRVSVFGEPMERLSAYVLEGLRARLLSSGSIIYKKLKCKEPTSSELLSYMQVIYNMCPYYKFAYMSANVVIREAMTNENRVHIIDFQIAQGSQWMFLLHDLARRPGGPPFLRITGVDDSQSAHARGGGLQLVGERLAEVAKSCGVPFEFRGAALSGCEVQLENLHVRHGEALAVNFPYMLHHMPDESVSTINHRDRLLRLVKSLSPKIVTLVEQESNTNTAPFLPRFRETLDYYTAMFESIDAARPRDDKQRISAEEHCVARDVVNIIACEGADRVERHELFGKWRLRLMMAGFTPCPLSPSVGETINGVLKEYSPNYRFAESEGALYLGWKNRALATSSAWR